jgi:hypothetical protein
MPRSKGWKCSPEVKANMAMAAKNRESRIVKRYGMTQEFFEEQIKAGNIWCSNCKKFLPAAAFGNQKRKVRCTDCGREKCKAHYHKNPVAMNAKRMEYYIANRESELLKRQNNNIREYDLTPERYQEILAEQGGHCDLCTATVCGSNRGVFCIDHDHKTGAARGLLCLMCNMFLGYVEKQGINRKRTEDKLRDVEWGNRAVSYLKKHGSIA